MTIVLPTENTFSLPWVNNYFDAIEVCFDENKFGSLCTPLYLKGRDGYVSCGQSYKQFTLVIYESRVVIWGIFKSGTTLEL